MVLGFVTEEKAEKLRQLAERLKVKGLAEESSILDDLLADIGGQSAIVSTAEAAAILDVTQQTIRNWVRSGILPGGRDTTGHFFVARDALIPAIRMRQVMPDEANATISDAEIDAEIAAVRANRRAERAISQ
jgi:transposase-like protein